MTQIEKLKQQKNDIEKEIKRLEMKEKESKQIRKFYPNETYLMPHISSTEKYTECITQQTNSENERKVNIKEPPFIFAMNEHKLCEESCEKNDFIEKLMALKREYEPNWEPDWNDRFQQKCRIIFNIDHKKYVFIYETFNISKNNCLIYFSERNAVKIIKRLNEELEMKKRINNNEI